MAMEIVTNILQSDTTLSPGIITTLAIESVRNHSEVISDTASINHLSEDKYIPYTHTSLDNITKYNKLQITMPLFEAFILTEIVMTALELIISIIAAIYIPRWRKNYRNQMLMQISVARFVKRIIFYIEFTEEKLTGATPTGLDVVLFGAQTYIDFVIVILVVFFIKHMYDSLIVVIVKINQNTFYKMLSCAWLLPLPVSAVWAGIVLSKVLDEWLAYLFICCIFRWPLILLGTLLYITVLYRVFTDKIRKFARSLTFTTFFICLVVNFYLFSKDVLELWCFKSFVTVLFNYVLGFLLNLLILCFYLILIILNFKKKFKSTTSVPDNSFNDEAK